VGKVLSSHGIKGFFKIKSFSGESRHFFKIKKVHLLKHDKLEVFTVTKVLHTKGTLLMKIEGIDTPERIKEYSGCEIWVDNKYANPLLKGEYYIRDLCKCDVYLGKVKVGRVTAVCEGGRNDLLEVEDNEGKSSLVPFQDHFIGKIDTGKQRIYLREEYFLQ